MFSHVIINAFQIILQSVFIMRSYNDPVLRANSTLWIVVVSLTASLLTITDKYIWMDTTEYIFTDADMDFECCECPCMNPRFVLRAFWRFSLIVARFCALSLIWTVMSGWFFLFFLVFSLLSWMTHSFYTSDGAFGLKCVYGLMGIVSTFATRNVYAVCLRYFELISLLSTCTVFVLMDSFKCSICEDAQQRQADYNPYILLFIVVGWSSMAVEIVLYLILIIGGVFDEEEEPFKKGPAIELTTGTK